ncbi:thioredoxin family protein [Aquimarina sediminis]|uniref:thioredoxin family protein n=1 Tax=Aquimarina sediminis TaxID=2070536 RepID=UPI000CA04258|nr:thioredoxin family protein [Aquimarina sediminis]
MDTLIKDSIDKGITYHEYGKLIEKLVAKEQTTGKEQSETRIDFTRLNARRMKRLDKTIVLTEEDRNVFKKIQEKQTWLIIIESWCGDGAQTIPVLNKIAETTSFIDLKIVLRDENIELMNQFLTNGTQSIPKLIIVDQDNNVLHTWGSRSKSATALVTAYKNEHGKIDEVFKKNLQIWYNKDKGKSIIKDVSELMITAPLA